MTESIIPTDPKGPVPIFQPIVSLSTLDHKIVELLVGDRVMTGYFDGGPGRPQRWMCNHGKDPMPEGLYPSHISQNSPEGIGPPMRLTQLKRFRSAGGSADQEKGNAPRYFRSSSPRGEASIRLK